MAIRKIVSRSILDGAIAPVDTTGVATPTTLTVSGISTFPDLGSVQVTAPNRHSVDASLLLDFANTKTLDPRITFTRGSSATYYDGTTAMAEQNLILQSQTFDNAPWSGTALTVTGNVTTAPDGTNTADSIVPNTTSTANHQFAQNASIIANKTFTISIYVKAFGYTKFAFREAALTGAHATFNLASSGSVIETGNVAEVTILGATITSVGSGWFRVTTSFVSTSSSTLAMGFFPLNDTYTSGSPYNASFATGNGTSGVYIWGAQLEERSSATAYTPTTTTAIINYNTVLKTAGPNQARFDVDPITLESKGLLLEEQRTNLFTYSQNFTDGSWVKSGTTVESAVAPDGTLSAAKLSATTSTSDKNIYKAFTTTAQNYTMSLYAKAGGINSLAFYYSSNSGGPYPQFNLSNGTATNGGVMQFVGNGWYKCSHTFTAVSVTNLLAIYVNSTSSMTGNGFDGIYIWGAQVEAGSFPTSYIPTSASTVTRTFDYPVISGSNFSSWFNNTAGTVYVEAMAGLNSASGGNAFMYLVDSAQGAQNDIYMDIDAGAARFNAFDRGSLTTSINLSTATAGTSYKISAAYKLNDYAASKNGGAVVTDTSANVPAGLSQMIIGRDIFNALSLNSTIKKIAYYPIRLTNAELIGMTTA